MNNRELGLGLDLGLDLELVLEGYHCKECGQYVKIHRRRISKAMVISLSRLEVLKGIRSYKDFAMDCTDYSVLTCYKLIATHGNGFYSITDYGKQFLNGTPIPKNIFTFNGITLFKSKKEVYIKEVNHFFNIKDLVI